MAYAVENYNGLGSERSRKRLRKAAAVLGPAALAVGAIWAFPKIKSAFMSQGMSATEAETLAQDVIEGREPSPIAIPPEPRGVPIWVIPVLVAAGVGAFFFGARKRG